MAPTYQKSINTLKRAEGKKECLPNAGDLDRVESKGIGEIKRSAWTVLGCH